jgi:hypothetical protein
MMIDDGDHSISFLVNESRGVENRSMLASWALPC